MRDRELQLFKGKIIGGVFALTTRTFILQVITFAATFILTILLSPAVFGIFFVVSAVISFLKYFSDIGLAAALIQKKEEPERDDLVSVFTVQQLLVGGMVVLFFILSKQIAQFYNLSNEGIFLLKALLVAFFLSSLKTIPSILLERKLEFSRLVLPEIIETLSFYIVAVTLAYLNKGILSFAWAAIARGVTGVLAIYYVSPWTWGLGFSRSSISRLVTFGIPFQTNSLLALVKDDLLVIFLGKILPFSQMGYLGWAKKWAEAPLRLIMDSIIRVTFPAFSRIQKEKEILGKAIHKSLFFLAFFIFPFTLLMVLVVHPLIYIIPKYIKWEPALSAFYLFALSAVMASFSSPIVNAFNAMGKIKVTLILMIGWTILTWSLVPFLTFLIGYNGWPVASTLISLTSIVPLLIIKKYIQFPISTVYKPFIATLIAGFFTFFIIFFQQSLLGIIASIGVFILIYGFLAFKFMHHEIRPFLPKILHFR